MSRPAEPIAIVGMGAVFPDAPTPEAFWDNVAARRCSAREAPAGRWLLGGERIFDPAKGAPDKIYSLKACFVSDFRFDAGGLELPPALLERLDPLFHLALHAARQALSAARRVERSRTGVLIGNIVLPTESSSALTRELLLPAFEHGVFGRRLTPAPESRTDPANRFPAGLPAGLIARALGLGGAVATLDAACASSLYAVKLACEELRAGRADAMLSGGVSRPDSLYTQMGFSQLRALSPSGRPAPFDAGADGLVVGEGAGMFLLKRLSEALKDGDRVLGVIRGGGLSNDVGGSLLAPNTPGQLRAMRAAYREAGWSPSDVDYVECHATGTPTGDPVEVASLKALWGPRGWSAGQAALGSVKSNVGHLLTAAGAAGLAKMLLAFERKSLPPTANFTKPAPALGLEDSPFRVQAELAPWPEHPERPRRAALSGFGFGGINAHLLLEEWTGKAPRASPAPKRKHAPVAIVGMEARFGPLAGLRAFQEAALSGRAPAPRPPEGRWWGLPESRQFPGHYLREVGVAADAYRIPPKELAEMLPQQLLMLDVAARAIADAGLPAEARERAGVFIGLALDLNTNNFSFRWSLREKARVWARALGWTLSEEEEERFAAALREAAGPALSANRTMGALGGIVASRVAREFQVGGPSFTVSSEESSGLRALELAARALERGEIDSAIVGAVDIAGDARAVLGADAFRPFSRSGACRPFERDSTGALPGEGAACVVLKRLDDALKDGDRVYAVLKGVGSASGGALEAPRPESCVEALRRAYSESGVDPATVGYLEANAGGAPAEDAAEASALAEFFGTAAAELPCALGALKPLIGHSGAASGLAAVVKAALALYQEILPACPPFAPVAELARARERFHAPRRAQYWLRNRAEGPRRAGVSALGLDGSVTHAVLEAAEGLEERERARLERRQPLGAREEALFAVEADSAEGLLTGLRRLREWAAGEDAGDAIERLARRWFARERSHPERALGIALVARDWKELLALTRGAEDSIAANPERPIAGDRIYLTYRAPFGKEGVAFVFPGSGNHYVGMGVGFGAQWPEVLRRQDAENGYLRRQMAPERVAPWRLSWEDGWAAEAEARLSNDYKSLIFSSVSFGTVMSDWLRGLGVEPRFAIGYSLGETTGLFALRAWTARDEMLRRMNQSSLFVSDLAGPCDALRQFWSLPKNEKVDWVLGVIDRPADAVRSALQGAKAMERAALLIVNAPLECVVGGYKKAVESLVEGLGCVFLPLQGVSTVHFPAAKLVEKQYRELHLLPTRAPEGVSFYSGAWGKSYPVTREKAADSITAQAVGSFDFSVVVRQAYEDGARLFIELGPQSSTTRMIGKILGPRPHGARSLDMRGHDELGAMLRALAWLIAERVPVDLEELYGKPSLAVGHQDPPEDKPKVRLPLGGEPFRPLAWRPPAPTPPPPAPRPAEAPVPSVPAFRAPQPASAPRPLTGAARAHAAFLRLTQNYIAYQSKNLSCSVRLSRESLESLTLQDVSTPVFMDREKCLEFAVGEIGKVLGEAFREVDSYPTRVRLPDEPLMLVDRILEVRGEPRSLGAGAVVTEHDVLPGAWYLDGGRIPTCIAVEAGQADLFLSGYLGIDFKTKGRAVYRLLDAEIVFHDELPAPGRTIRYDIRINRFVPHGEDTWLFFFEFDGTVDGKPLLTMRNGCAGFFTRAALEAGKGVVLTEEERRPAPGKKPADWRALAPWSGTERYDEAQLDALRRGELAAAFGPAFTARGADAPALPSGRMKLVDRVLELDLRGGRYGLGIIRGEMDIHPDDWHLVCHFKDDNVMPGTLMYECCLHTMRVLLLRLGWTAEGRWEPVPGVKSRLKCRGQVLASTKKAVYEVSIKELGYENGDGAPYAVADALMYADGKPIVRIEDMCLRLSGADRRAVEAPWRQAARGTPLFDHEKILAFAVGKPSEAFGERYKVFDEERVIARLPGPPYQFLDRIMEIEGCRPWELKAGARILAEYDVPPEAWYFKENGQPTMPFAVLLEAALQPCGWLAAYLGSALTSPVDLSFRNLGGKATQYEELGPDAGTLQTRVTLTKVSQSGGMIIQDFDFELSRAGRPVYKGSTEFGFFTKAALSQQVGLRGASLPEPSGPLERLSPELPGMPGPKLLLLDEVEFSPGLLRGRRKVNPSEWFFKAHFYQDPVCPGSLGLESFIQLMKLAARKRWGAGRFESMALGRAHEWLYRGQYTPVNKQVELFCALTEADERERLLRADGYLVADGLAIYRMKDFTLRLRP